MYESWCLNNENQVKNFLTQSIVNLCTLSVVNPNFPSSHTTKISFRLLCANFRQPFERKRAYFFLNARRFFYLYLCHSNSCSMRKELLLHRNHEYIQLISNQSKYGVLNTYNIKECKTPIMNLPYIYYRRMCNITGTLYREIFNLALLATTLVHQSGFLKKKEAKNMLRVFFYTRTHTRII